MKKNVLKINICGLEFQVSSECLARYPNTLLGNPKRRQQYYDEKKKQYFFNRHRLAFEGILMYYQNFGRVICPKNVPVEVFVDELEFFMIECDYVHESKKIKKYVLNMSQKAFSGRNIKEQIWKVMNCPTSSKGAQILSFMSLFMTCTSITISCIYPGNQPENFEGKDLKIFPFETICFVWFTCEYMTRLITCPSKFDFLKSWIDLTDLITLLIFYISLALTTAQASSTSVLRIFRLANAFRVFRLTRFSNGLRLLLCTIYNSRTDLQLLIGFMGFYIMIAGSTIYFIESMDPKSQFTSGGIFDGIWFSLVSCTTIGYGDIVPVSVLGKVATSCTIVCGAALILLPVLKLVTSFSDALQATKSILTEPELSYT